MRIHYSTDTPDPAWDRFVESCEWGQFQQTSMWAEAKVAEGWGVRRLLVSDGDRLVGGAQVLHKSTRFGRIAFVNKGPLHEAGRADVATLLESELVKLQADGRYRGLLVHLPDDGASGVPSLLRRGFMPEVLFPVITSTLVIDLSKGWEWVHEQFSRTTRKKLRQAEKRGVSVVEGTPADLPEFYELMVSTCQRQGSQPSPRSLKTATSLVDAFGRQGRVRIWFAVHGGRRVAGGLALLCGKRVTFWKKGWDQSVSESNANVEATSHIIRWATEAGYRWLDFASVDGDIAEALIHGRELPEDVTTRRDFFNLGFGGEGRIMPPCLVRFRNPLVGGLYRLATGGPFRKSVKRMTSAMGLLG